MEGRKLENKTMPGRTLVGRTLEGRSLPNRSARDAYQEQEAQKNIFSEVRSTVGIENFKVYETKINQFHPEGKKIILGVYAPRDLKNYMHIYRDDFVCNWGDVNPLGEKVLATYHHAQLIGIVKQSELQ